MRDSPALRYPRSLWSHNPLPTGCVLYLPLWNPGLRGSPFKSIDSYRRDITLTGTTLGATGRTFNGTSDLGVCGRILALEGASNTWSIIFWWKQNSTAAVNTSLLAYDNNDTLNNTDIWLFWDGEDTELKFQLGGEEETKLYTGQDLDDHAWRCIAFKKTANNVVIDINGSNVVDTAMAGGNMAADYKFYICDDLNVGFGDGIMGELAIYDRTVATVESNYYYNKTKRRYV